MPVPPPQRHGTLISVRVSTKCDNWRVTTTTPDEDGTRRPRCLISYSHDNSAHRQHIVDIANALQANGIEVMIDRYVEHDPPLSWPRWMREQIEAADVVLVVATKTYAERYYGRPDPLTGRGADWEGLLITGDLYSSHRAKVKFIPVVTNSADIQYIPDVLNQTTSHNLHTLSQEELVPLVRQIHGKPSVVPAPLGVPNFGLQSDPVNDAAGTFNDDPVTAERQLNALAGNSDPDVAARAAFTLGEIFYRSQQYSRSAEAFTRAVQCGPKTTVYEAAMKELLNVAAVMREHFGPDSAGTFARGWMADIQTAKIGSVWRSMDKSFRTVLAQDWVLANENHPNLQGIDRETLAAELCKIEPAHDLATPFLTSQLNKLRAIATEFDSSWGLAEKPRRHGLDFEIVIFSPTDGEVLIWDQGTKISMLPIVLRRRVGEWKIVNIGVPPSIPVPGWPPSRDMIKLEGISYPDHPNI